MAALAVVAATLALCSLAPAASAHVDAPTVTAGHAFVGDPLFGLDTPEGTLLGKLPDDPTQMGSTTKVWTLDLTAHALAQGKVHLDDKVTITAFEASFDPAGNSLMTDFLGKPLEAGEVVSLRDLVRGMMYQSGNDAAHAIARHVARAYYGPAADWPSFVAMMNAHAAALGQAHTQLDNPAGWDRGVHQTTARELAQEFQHGLQDPYFAQVVGFSGMNVATTQGPNGPKTYLLGWGRDYPGWEGEKGGSTPKCNGQAAGCAVRAATRIGRRVVIARMQGPAGNAEDYAMLDHGFASIFHPDPRATSAPLWSDVDRQDVDCLDDGRAVSAVLPPTGPVKLVLWKPDVDGSFIASLQQTSLPGSGYWGRMLTGDVAVTHLPAGDVILATRMGPNVELSRWGVNRAGTLTLLASGIKAGAATSLSLQPVSSNRFLTALTEANGDLVLKSWRLDGAGLALDDTYTSDFYNYVEVATTGPRTADVFTGYRAVTVAVRNHGPHVHSTWGIDEATGKISLINEMQNYVTASNIGLTSFEVTAFDGELLPPAYYALAFRTESGNLAIQVYRIDGAGKPFLEETVNTATPIEQARVAPLGTGGVMSVTRDSQGYVQLTAWELRRLANNDVKGAAVSQHWAPGAASVDICRLPSQHAEGDYVTATEDTDGLLRLRAYRSGDRPY